MRTCATCPMTNMFPHPLRLCLQEKDYPGALSFFRRSARAGYLLARFREGQMLEAGMDDWHTPR